MTLTKQDLNQIDIRLENQKEGILDEIDEKLSKLKSEFFERIDPILKEVITAREERPLIENRLEDLEKIHQTGKHALTS